MVSGANRAKGCRRKATPFKGHIWVIWSPDLVPTLVSHPELLDSGGERGFIDLAFAKTKPERSLAGRRGESFKQTGFLV